MTGIAFPAKDFNKASCDVVKSGLRLNFDSAAKFPNFKCVVENNKGIIILRFLAIELR
jgi:hypothetical protein